LGFLWILLVPRTTLFKKINSHLLKEEVVLHLCTNFEIPVSDPLCDGKGLVFAYDFFTYIEGEVGKTLFTYSDFEHVLAAYNIWEHRPPGYQIDVRYDLGGDGHYIIYAKFDEGDEKLLNLIASTER
jgi:hypothetical protein